MTPPVNGPPRRPWSVTSPAGFQRAAPAFEAVQRVQVEVASKLGKLGIRLDSYYAKAPRGEAGRAPGPPTRADALVFPSESDVDLSAFPLDLRARLTDWGSWVVAPLEGRALARRPDRVWFERGTARLALLDPRFALLMPQLLASVQLVSVQELLARGSLAFTAFNLSGVGKSLAEEPLARVFSTVLFWGSTTYSAWRALAAEQQAANGVVPSAEEEEAAHNAAFGKTLARLCSGHRYAVRSTAASRGAQEPEAAFGNLLPSAIKSAVRNIKKETRNTEGWWAETARTTAQRAASSREWPWRTPDGKPYTFGAPAVPVAAAVLASIFDQVAGFADKTLAKSRPREFEQAGFFPRESDSGQSALRFESYHQASRFFHAIAASEGLPPHVDDLVSALSRYDGSAEEALRQFASPSDPAVDSAWLLRMAGEADQRWGAFLTWAAEHVALFRLNDSN